MFKRIKQFFTKANPAQSSIADETGIQQSTTPFKVKEAYKRFPILNRGANLIADSVAGIPIDVGAIIPSSNRIIKKKKLIKLLNFEPNLHITSEELIRNVVLDLLFEGDAYLYWDGAFIYNLPAARVEVVPDEKTYVKKYLYGSKRQEFLPSEIIHIKENGISSGSLFTGTARIEAAADAIAGLLAMSTYQKNFFSNNAMVGLVIEVPDTTNSKRKLKIQTDWMQDFNPTNGRRVAVIDGGAKLTNVNQHTFKDLDFSEGVIRLEDTVLEVLGIPPVLLRSGNNANISPNNKLFYLNTVLPLLNKILASFERFFGYDLKAAKTEVEALRPELRDLGVYYTSLTNGGIITRNEARDKLRFPKHEDSTADNLILPANIAGSNANPDIGGAPKK